MTDDRPESAADRPNPEWPEGTNRDDGSVPASEARDPEREADLQLIGMMNPGTPVFHSPESGLLYHGDVRDDGGLIPRPDDEVDVDVGSDRTLSDAIRDLGERLGWESLTDHGRDHWDDESSRD
ncbi:hypothetical protein [Natronococcus sp. A-GB7]|uniref:hypothetical protein n=1 Tax=Natronococcus sp. A-GB7 TaxID=3037649 RepID=UPI00241F12E2|nr:hypothetical protein [Natronococcus sp. A-GB7]MDG5817800.1 hypothetical protein [Natronococcus sp. A-GB7]